MVNLLMMKIRTDMFSLTNRTNENRNKCRLLKIKRSFSFAFFLKFVFV